MLDCIRYGLADKSEFWGVSRIKEIFLKTGWVRPAGQQQDVTNLGASAAHDPVEHRGA